MMLCALRRAYRVPAAMVVAIFLAWHASAELIQFEILTGVAPRLLTVESVLVEETAHVPLQLLVEQAGGSYNVLPTRLRVDLGGSTAWLRVGESRVHALSIFSLGRPIAEDASGALIATADIPDFFLKSFRVTVRPYGGQSAAPATPQVTPPPGETSTQITMPTTEAPEAPPALEQLGALPRQPGVVTAVVIDAGHGGYDTGIQATGQRDESTISLAVAQRLKSLLESAKAPGVILTRADATEISQQTRLRIAQSAPGSVFVSIHVGSSPSPTAEGIAIYYSMPATVGAPATRADAMLAAESKRLAETIGTATATAAGVPLRGVVQVPLKLLGELQVPAIEIEVGCLSSAADAARLESDEHLARVATGIMNGITAYLSGETPAAVPPAPTSTPEAD